MEQRVAKDEIFKVLLIVVVFIFLFLFYYYFFTQFFSCPLEGEGYSIRNKSYTVKSLIFTNSPSSEGKQLPMIDMEVLNVIVVDED